jgi:hypothetical protein
MSKELFKPLESTTRGLKFEERSLKLPPKLKFERWVAVGETLKQIQGGASWWVGDWLVYGMDHFGENDMYAQATEETPYTHGSLRNMAWVARCFPPEARSEVLTFSHYKILAGLDPADRGGWEVEAIEQGLSVGGLRQAIAEWRAKNQEAPGGSEGSGGAGGGIDTGVEDSQAYIQTRERVYTNMTPGVRKMLDGVAENIAKTLELPTLEVEGLMVGAVVRYVVEQDEVLA